VQGDADPSLFKMTAGQHVRRRRSVARRAMLVNRCKGELRHGREMIASAPSTPSDDLPTPVDEASRMAHVQVGDVACAGKKIREEFARGLID